MKIGRKIALFYTLVTVLTTMAVIGVFYLFSSRYISMGCTGHTFGKKLF